MKSNKLTNLFKKDISFLGHAKYYFVALAAILISAIIIVSVIGMKIGFDFQGGTIVEVVYGVEFDNEGNPYPEDSQYTKDIAKEKIEKVLGNVGGFEISTIQDAKGEYGNKVVYKLLSNEKISNDQYETIKTKLYEEFDKYNATGLLQSKYITVYGVPGSANNAAVYGSIALAVSVVLLSIGVAIRYGFSAMFSILLTSLINIALAFATVIICRVSVDAQFIGSVLTIFVLTLIANLIYLDKAKENFKNKELSRNDVVNLSVKQTLVTNALILSVSLISVIFLTGFGVLALRSYGIPVILGTLYAFFSAIYVLPWLNFKIDFKKKPKIKKSGK